MDVGVSDRLRPVAVPSFDEWVAARVVPLLRFAYLLTGSQSEAEDAVQGALERALAAWPRVSRTDDPETYVRRMIVNQHISVWRRWRRRVSPVAVVRETDTAGDPGEEVAAREAVRRLCAMLPPTQRAAVVLRYYEDRDYAEIAALLGCAEATARSHVHRALRVLRGELAKEDEDDA